MKKRIIALVAMGVMAVSMVGCGADKTAEVQSTEENQQMANPWRDSTEEEANATLPNCFTAPEEATNVKWSIMDATDETAGDMVQMNFTWYDMEFTAREQIVVDAETDISGMNYEWTSEEDINLSNWNMAGKTYFYSGDDESVQLCTWYDKTISAAYSVSVASKDLDGFDIQAIAEGMYKQADAAVGAEDENSVEFIKKAAEETAPQIDISDCDTFTHIVNKLDKEMGYQNIKVNGVDVLIITSGTYDNLDDEGNQAAIDGTLYIYKDQMPYKLGSVCSGGTAYPITLKDGYLYTGSNHWVCKWTIKDDALYVAELASVQYDENGDGTYSYVTEDGTENSDMDQKAAEEKLDSLFNEMFEGEVINFFPGSN